MPTEEEFSKIAKQELSYDAWGRLRNPATHVAYTPGSEPALFLGRGYTGHEHLSSFGGAGGGGFGLINMNARLYDPLLGRFLSPDPYVQAPDFTQNFNRYSYCLNNPLTYIDPSGEWFLIDDLIAAVVGGVVNLTVNLIQGNVRNFGHGAALFGVGFAGGVASLYVSPLVGAGLVSGGNGILNQGFTTGWNNIDWGQVGISTIMGVATSYLGGQLGNTLAKPISNLTSDITSPVLREALTQGATNAAVGFGLSAGLAWGNGASFEEGLKQGGQGALMGAGIGVMTGTVAGVQYARDNKVNPWTGKDLNLNSDKISLGTRNPLNSESNSYNGRIVTNPAGDQVTLDIPSDYIMRSADNGNGVVYQAPDSTGNANMIRIMGTY
ncbi:RHS repeat-associated core domain-containing protein [Proteiniphilum sp. X52]|uniref:RHS repeat-associated core domain-containing protein n=1 Tax=Proteiniphilum sp. X52 TaxID=2382159 RepID=UPI0026D70443